MSRPAKPIRIVLAGGGTAGHTSPLIATADALRRARPDAEITCLGVERGLETRVVPAAGYRLELIPAVPLPRKPSIDLVRVPARLGRAVLAARDVITTVDPDVVVGFGGYVSMPAYLATRLTGVPLVIHEQNALPGIANKLGARFCTNDVATSFPETPLRNARFVGLPLRRAISQLDRAAARSGARLELGLHPDLPTLLVTGGSQGSRRINETMGAVAVDLARAGVQVLHVKGHQGEVSLPADRPVGVPYVVVSYLDDMATAYAAADATVARAGASSVTEAAALGLPAVFVPLAIGNGEQAMNARAVVDAGGALLVDNADFTPEWARATLPDLMADERRLGKMSVAAARLIRRDADERLAAWVIEVASR